MASSFTNLSFLSNMLPSTMFHILRQHAAAGITTPTNSLAGKLLLGHVNPYPSSDVQTDIVSSACNSMLHTHALAGPDITMTVLDTSA